MTGSHRAPRSPSVARRFIALSVVLLALIGAGTAWVAGVGPGRGSSSATEPGPEPSWRTGWALSLAHTGLLDGSDLTCRIISRVALSGSQIRFRLVNYPATSPVTFSHVMAAIRTDGEAVDPATQHEVTFNGSASITLAPNGDVLTDPVDLPVVRGQDVALSVAVSSGVSAPWHYWTSQKSACTRVGAGDVAGEASGAPFNHDSQDRWLSEVQVLAIPVTTVAAYGDSLTDGLFLPQDTNRRWTDLLEGEADGRLVVLNYGVSGDRITGSADGGVPRRVTTDVLAPAGVSAVVVELGSNDIAAGVSASTIADQIRRVADLVQAAGKTLIVATVPARDDEIPKGADHQRRLLNQELRTYPIVADLDAALTDPRTGKLALRYDSGDQVHPNAAGVEVIAQVMRGALEKVPGPVAAALT